MNEINIRKIVPGETPAFLLKKKQKVTKPSLTIFWEEGGIWSRGTATQLKEVYDENSGELVGYKATMQCRQCKKKLDEQYCQYRFRIQIWATFPTTFQEDSPILNPRNWEILERPKNPHRRL